MGKKTNAPKPLSSKLQTLIATAASIGFAGANQFGRAVELVRQVKGNSVALGSTGAEYKAGYIAGYLSDETAFAKRWDNMDESAKIEEAKLIYAKSAPETTKADRRTELEHKACRAADTSWSTVKRRAGIAAKKGGGRAPRTGTTEGNVPPVDLVKAAPELATREAANDYFATAAAALLATVNKNVKAGKSNPIAPAISSAVQAFREALVAAGLITVEPAKV